MKRMISIFLALILTLGLCACGSGSKEETELSDDWEYDVPEEPMWTTGLEEGEVIEITSDMLLEWRDQARKKMKRITLDDVMKVEPLSEDHMNCSHIGERECEVINGPNPQQQKICAFPETWYGQKIVKIGNDAFTMGKFNGLRLPDSLRELGESAFSSSDYLQIVYCGSGLKTIGLGAFEACLNLHTVVLPEGLERIGACAFQGTSLQSIEIPASVTEIGDYAFNCLLNEDFVIIGTPGSYAEQYAAEQGIPFQPK